MAKKRYIRGLFMKALHTADFLAPVASVAIRLWIANVFWQSGITKINSWNTTLFLFENEYSVPFIPVECAAYSATAFELLCPVLLVIGLLSRFAALPLLVMTAVIEFTYQSNMDHIVWAIMLATIALQGPGRFSMDYFFTRSFIRKVPEDKPTNNVVAFFAVVGLVIFAGIRISNDLL